MYKQFEDANYYGEIYFVKEADVEEFVNYMKENGACLYEKKELEKGDEKVFIERKENTDDYCPFVFKRA